MSNPVQYERRSIPERRIDQRRSEPVPRTPPPLPEREPHTKALAVDRLWTVREAALFLARSTSWVYKAAERGELPRARGMAWGLRFVPSELHAYARGEMSGPHAMVRTRDGGA
jgi:predicted DNA-binding transcriptional regulator AlpA